MQEPTQAHVQTNHVVPRDSKGKSNSLGDLVDALFKGEMLLPFASHLLGLSPHEA